jgi:hypothetical protein
VRGTEGIGLRLLILLVLGCTIWGTSWLWLGMSSQHAPMNGACPSRTTAVASLKFFSASRAGRLRDRGRGGREGEREGGRLAVPVVGGEGYVWEEMRTGLNAEGRAKVGGEAGREAVSEERRTASLMVP